MSSSQARRLLRDPQALVSRVTHVLARARRDPALHDPLDASWTSSAVLLVLTTGGQRDATDDVGVVLTKRSRRVRQAGDLCFPGGGLAWRMDPCLARLLTLPRLPLRRAPGSFAWRGQRTGSGHPVELLLAAALREGFEEMRIQPWRVSFLGMLPAQRLRLLRRAMHPAVVWMPRRQRFRPNWEVDRVVVAPLAQLLDPGRYARYRVRIDGMPVTPERMRQDFACVQVTVDGHTEVLWGATLRVTLRLLHLVFGFEPPAPASCPLVEGTLDAAYLTGRTRR